MKSSYSRLTSHGSWISQVHDMCLWPNTQWLNQSASNDPGCRRVMWWPAREATLHLKNNNCSSWRGLCRCGCYVRTAECRDGYWNLVLDWPRGQRIRYIDGENVGCYTYYEIAKMPILLLYTTAWTSKHVESMFKSVLSTVSHPLPHSALARLTANCHGKASSLTTQKLSVCSLTV